MDKEEILFGKIAETLSGESRHVAPGKMMSSPGITYKGKVFAFYHKKEMVFRLGKAFAPETFKLKEWSLLNPFKNKPPLAGWFQVPSAGKRKWEKLARQALGHMIGEREKNDGHSQPPSDPPSDPPDAQGFAGAGLPRLDGARGAEKMVRSPGDGLPECRDRPARGREIPHLYLQERGG